MDFHEFFLLHLSIRSPEKICQRKTFCEIKMNSDLIAEIIFLGDATASSKPSIFTMREVLLIYPFEKEFAIAAN